MKILIADDEEFMLKILKAYFEKDGFQVILAQDGEEALQIFYQQQIDLAILDWMMPKMSGIEVCEEIKKQSCTKVLLLTAKSEFDDELLALRAGADEYVRKPFDPRVLILRVKKILQREKELQIKNVKIDMEGQKISRDGKVFTMTKKELALMQCFVENKGKLLSRQTLLDRVWGFEFLGDERTLDTHIRRLRQKIGEDLIRTHRGLGYSLEGAYE